MSDTSAIRLGGKVALVTGGNRGLGREMALGFARAGADVVVASRHEDACAAFATQLRDEFGVRALGLGLHVGRWDTLEPFVERVHAELGSIDVLVNNAGVARDGILALMSDEDSDTVIDLNLKATIHLTRQVVRNMLAKGGGRIVNISSITGLTGYRGLTVYGATKAAIDGFTRGLAREVGSRKITVNSIASGYLRTEMSHGLDEGQLNQIVRRTPAGRLGEPDDIARTVQFLVDERNDWLTGQVLVVDGGLTC
jgi:3-oxoacyl-[acyl-carrier protein] reductase